MPGSVFPRCGAVRCGAVRCLSLSLERSQTRGCLCVRIQPLKALWRQSQIFTRIPHIPDYSAHSLKGSLCGDNQKENEREREREKEREREREREKEDDCKRKETDR